MHQSYAATGFVFKREDRLEADRVFTVFTREFGRVEIIARAIRKIASKLKGGIDIFWLCDLEFIQGKNRKTLIDAKLVEKFGDIAQSSEKLAIAGRVCSLLDDFILWQECDPKIWDLVLDFFRKLNDFQLEAFQLSLPAGRQELVYDYFFWNFVTVLGYGPQLYNCVACHQKLAVSALYFSNKEGGVVCRLCLKNYADALPISHDAVKVLRIMLKTPPAGGWDMLLKLKISPGLQTSLQEISKNYLQYLIL